MFVKKKDYKELVNRSKLVDELEKEINRLAKLITSETKDCKIGTWCNKCIHLGCDNSIVQEYDSYFDWLLTTVAEGGKVYYCKKHLHEICPEFEMLTQKEG